MFSSIQDAQEALISVGYITDEVTTTSVFLAAQLEKPVLLEGPPGSGKTELAYAVAKATGAEVERLQCYDGINEEKAIGKFDESLQRLWVELLSKSGNLNWETVKQEIHGEQFFSAGPLLRALRHEKRCVLLIDELDKVDHAFEAPERWPLYEGDCRRFPLFRFPYVVVYRQKSTAVVEIVAIAHGRRRPGYWRGRTK